MVDFRFSQSRVFRPRQFFQRRFAMPIEKYGDAAKHCDRSFSPLFCGVSKLIAKSFKTLEKQEMAVFCGLSTEQADSINAWWRSLWLKLNQLKDCNVGDDFGSTCEAQTNL